MPTSYGRPGTYGRPWTRCTPGAASRIRSTPPLQAFFDRLAPHAALHRPPLAPRGGGPLGRVLHRHLHARSLIELELAGAAHAPLIASAVAATFTGVLAD